MFCRYISLFRNEDTERIKYFICISNSPEKTNQSQKNNDLDVSDSSSDTTESESVSIAIQPLVQSDIRTMICLMSRLDIEIQTDDDDDRK